MSRIGKAPVVIPEKVEVTIDGNLVTAKGPLGTEAVTVDSSIRIIREENKLILERTNEERQTRALHGLSRTLVNNVVQGVSVGFVKNLEIQGVGYRASKDGNDLVLALGYSHPVRIVPPAGIEIIVEGNTKLSIKGANKQAVGDVAAEIRSKRPPEVYKGKGVRYVGEVVRRKAGKTGKK
ncbi:MAG: 50S ribosomal protein L6 [bacterium]